jgi:hypothetical protein
MLEILLLLTGLSTALATLAVVCAFRAIRIRNVPRLRLERNEHELADIAERHALLHSTVKRLQSRISMRDAREKRHEPDQGAALGENETPEQWKTRMRQALAARKIGPTPTGGGPDGR